MGPAFPHPSVRPARQAGRFYDADASRLRQDIERLLAAAPAPSLPDPPRALVVPHAGYQYSGPVAAAAYRQVAGRPLQRLLLLAPSHTIDFYGAALPTVDAFATPLGNVGLDRAAVQWLAGKPGFGLNDDAHDAEHSIEVQLPFLQVALDQPFALLPVALGRVPVAGRGLPNENDGLEILAAPLVEVLDQWSRQNLAWLILASTDTYHGHDAEACAQNDQRLAALIERLAVAELMEATAARAVMACGRLALALAMELTRRHKARQGLILSRSDSRAASGPGCNYLVGYLAAALV